MNRRVLEDIKLNKNHTINPVKTVSRSLNVPKTIQNLDFKSKNISEPIKEIKSEIKIEERLQYSPSSDPNKYDFLKKKESSFSSSKRISYTPQMPNRGKSFNKAILWVFILALLVGIFYLLSTTFFRAKVTVVPKIKIFNLDGEKFVSSKKNNIPFEVMIVDDTESKSVVFTTSREASDKAKGQITLYNEYSNKPIKLISGTFISDDKGKSYKIDASVSIPGYTSLDSKITPGEAIVGVTSFLPGEAYNGSPEMFYINSYKDTDKYKKIYGKIKAPLVGGALGLVYFADDVDKEKILSNVSTSRDKLLRKLNALVPPGYILYPDSINYSYSIDPNILSKTPSTKLNINGTLSAVLLKKTELASSIIDKLLPDISSVERKEIAEPDLSSLSFAFTDKAQIINKEMDNFEFQLKGNLSVNWNPNTDQLKNQLIGKNKNEIANIFKQDPGISSASVSIMPFWSKKIPSVPEKISIIMKK